MASTLCRVPAAARLQVYCEIECENVVSSLVGANGPSPTYHPPSTIHQAPPPTPRPSTSDSCAAIPQTSHPGQWPRRHSMGRKNKSGQGEERRGEGGKLWDVDVTRLLLSLVCAKTSTGHSSAQDGGEGSRTRHISSTMTSAAYCKSTNGPCIHACAMIYRVYGTHLLLAPLSLQRRTLG